MTGDLGYWLGVVIAFLTSLTATTPAVRVTPPAPQLAGPCAEWAPLALELGWSPDEWPTLSRVMRCESDCKPTAHNRSGASGLLQIMPMWWGGRDPYDPAANLTMGLEVHAAQGWRAWSCY